MPFLAFLPTAVPRLAPSPPVVGRPHRPRPRSPLPASFSFSLSAARHRRRPPACNHRASAEKPAAATTDAVLDDLRTYLRAAGVRLHGVEIRAVVSSDISSSSSSSSSERGLYATRALAPGADLLELPRDAALVEGAAQASSASLHVFRVVDEAAWALEPWYIRLAVRLLDVAAASSHALAPYIAALPPRPASALWAAHQLGPDCVAQHLSAYGIADSTTRLYRDVCDAHARFLAMLPPLRVDSDEASRAMLAAASRDRFVWAVSIVLSRAFAVPPSAVTHEDDKSDKDDGSVAAQPAVVAHDAKNVVLTSPHPVAQTTTTEPTEFALFPALDMANHSVRAASTLRRDAATGHYVVRCARAHAAGEQVYVSYGARGNDELVQFYGVAEGGNPANTVVVSGARAWLCGLLRVTTRAGVSVSGLQAVDGATTPPPPPTGGGCGAAVATTTTTTTAAMRRRAKFDVLRRLDVVPRDEPFRLRADGEDPALLSTLRVVLADATEVAQLVAAPHAATKAVSLRNELAVWDVLSGLCDTLLNDTPEFDAAERARLTSLFGRRDPAAGWTWRGACDGKGEAEAVSDGELLFRHERDAVLDAVRRRVRHFAKISRAVGRVCTVLVPGGQSVLRTHRFDAGADAGAGAAGGADGASGGGAGMVSFDVDTLLGLHASLTGGTGGRGSGEGDNDEGWIEER